MYWPAALGGCLLLLLQVSDGVNIYQSCGYLDAFTQTSRRVDSLVKGVADPPYSYQFNATHTIYYNFCTGTSRCHGGVLCMEGPDGVLRVFAAPGENVSTDWFGSTLELFYNPIGYGYASFYFHCNETQLEPILVRGVDYYEENQQMQMSFTTPIVCQDRPLASLQPKSYEYLSGKIFMAGKLSMWAYDYVASEEGRASFVGSFQYSLPDMAFKLVGTLSNSKGQQSPVSLIVHGLGELGNPPTAVSIFQPTQGGSTCALLPILSHHNKTIWFSPLLNPTGVSRSYKSIYWEKGATFSVTEYFNTPYFTLIQRQSDQATVALGQYFLAPFTDPQYNTMVSEVKWDSLDSTPLPSSLFDFPSACMQ